VRPRRARRQQVDSYAVKRALRFTMSSGKYTAMAYGVRLREAKTTC
jgi:hypothetical protein